MYTTKTGALQKENDSTYISRYYTKAGPMVKWETYKDQDMEIPNGKFAYYNAKGTVDSMGWVIEGGRKDSTWFYKDAKGKVILQEKYSKGKLTEKTNYITKKKTYANGTIEDLEPKVPKLKDTASSKDDKVFTVVQVPAEYEGGLSSWNKYLTSNLKTPERFLNLYKKKSYKGTVVVNFIVNKEGIVDDVFIEQSCEWSTDMECIRVLKASPKWKPAVQNGRNVIYRHRQSLSFQVTEE
jgi:protein TonB